MNAHRLILQEATAFAEANIQQLCRDVLDWEHTGVIAPGALFNDLVRMLRPLSSSDALTIARTLVTTAAMQRVAQ